MSVFRPILINGSGSVPKKQQTGFERDRRPSKRKLKRNKSEPKRNKNKKIKSQTVDVINESPISNNYKMNLTLIIIICNL